MGFGLLIVLRNHKNLKFSHRNSTLITGKGELVDYGVYVKSFNRVRLNGADNVIYKDNPDVIQNISGVGNV